MPTTRKPGANQPPLMNPVPAGYAREEAPDADLDAVTVPQVPMQAVEQFAAAIAAVEVMARLGAADLIMEVARIAYTKSKQTERGRTA